MKISLVMATARSNYPIEKMEPHFFDLTLDSLEKQTFTDFEFIIVDALHHKRPNFFENKKYSFPIKHIIDKPSIWYDGYMWALCSARNQGIIHSDGELVVFIDDTFGFEKDWLEIFWKYYNEDVLFAQSLANFYTPDGEKFIDGDGEWVRDSRWKFLEENSDHLKKHRDGFIHTLGDWFYVCGGAAVSMDMLLRVNGFDENFDGTKSLEDCDLGRRLVKMGCEFIFDTKLKSNGYYYPLDTLTSGGLDFKSNIPLVEVNSNRQRIRVNNDLLTEEEINYVREQSPIWGVPIDEELFSCWVENQNIFDLDELRDERIENEMLNI